MDVLEAIRTRRSVRKYRDIPVEWEKVGLILDSGRLAPSAGNIQNWKFIVITDRNTRHQISEACLEQQWMAKAPVHIVIVAEPEKARRFYGLRGEKLYTIQNCAAATENMILAAHSLGLGTCWIGAFDEERIKEIVPMPDFVRPQSIITVGYPDEIVPTPVKYTLENIMFFRSYG